MMTPFILYFATRMFEGKNQTTQIIYFGSVAMVTGGKIVPRTDPEKSALSKYSEVFLLLQIITGIARN